MEYLIDTHVLIWYLDGNNALPHELVTALENADKIFVSIASLWELTIKTSLQKIDLAYSLEQIQAILINDPKYIILGISFAHLNILQTLSFFHKDPFDRLLIAQSISEDLTIISADKHFAAYPAKVIWQ